MYLGKAHVVTASSGFADYLVNGETVLTVPPGNETAMRTAIRLLLSQTRDLQAGLGMLQKCLPK